MRKLFILFAVVFLAVLLLTVASPTTASAAGPAYYVVRYGDSLDMIAWRYGTTSWALARANGIWNPNVIYIGQVLVIPYTGYNCYGCWGYQPPIPQPVVYPQPTMYGCYYWVRYGDTLSSISWRFGKDVWSIARANGIYNLNWIYAGQRLLIPGCY